MAERKRMATRNPRNGSSDYEMPVFEAAEVSTIAGRLRTSQPQWASLSCAERLAALSGFAQALAERRDELLNYSRIDELLPLSAVPAE